jgi:hypothetical protein
MPKRAWRAGCRVADRVAPRIFHYRGRSRRLQLLGKGDPLFLRPMRHPLTWQAIDNPRLIDVGIATLDDPAAVEPRLHISTESRIAWFETADHLLRYPTERPSSAP